MSIEPTQAKITMEDIIPLDKPGIRPFAPQDVEVINKMLNIPNMESAVVEYCKTIGVALKHLGSPKTLEWLGKYITTDKDTQREKDKCKLLSNTEDVVTILGETGTGKELLAQALHGARTGKFIALNCAAIPDELIESEMFGHVAGAFTGAIKDRIGKFQAAYDGTLFLDEVGELPLMAQASLLRVLQEKKIVRVGSNDEIAVKVRIVCATWHNLEEQVAKGLFRTDLYYRLTRIILKTKPLASRPEDLDLIITVLDKNKKVTPELREQIKGLPLKGNVRELENIIRRVELFGEI